MLIELSIEHSMQWHSTNGIWALVTMGPQHFGHSRYLLFSVQDHPFSTEVLPQFTCRVSLFFLNCQRIPTSLTSDQVRILPITSEELYLEEVGRIRPLEPGWSEYHLSHLLAVWPWISFLTFLGFQFLICTMGITIIPTSWGLWWGVNGYWMWRLLAHWHTRAAKEYLNSFLFAFSMYSKVTLSPETSKNSYFSSHLFTILVTDWYSYLKRQSSQCPGWLS